MTSSDNEILVKILDGQGQILLRLDALEAGQRVIVHRLDNLESRTGAIETEQKAIKSELQSQREDINANSRNIESLTQAMIQFDKTQEGLIHDVGHIQTSVNWVLGAIAVFAAVLGALPSIREWVKKPEPQHHTLTDYELDELARRVERRLSFK